MRIKIFIVVFLLAVAIGAPLGIKAIQARNVARWQRECVNHLQAIGCAKTIHAGDVGLKPGTVVSELSIAPDLVGGMPRCPAGGTYSINPIGKNPTCSVPGHSLTERVPTPGQ